MPTVDMSVFDKHNAHVEVVAKELVKEARSMIRGFSKANVGTQKQLLIEKIESMTADNADEVESAIKWHLHEHKEKLWEVEEKEV